MPWVHFRVRNQREARLGQEEAQSQTESVNSVVRTSYVVVDMCVCVFACLPDHPATRARMGPNASVKKRMLRKNKSRMGANEGVREGTEATEEVVEEAGEDVAEEEWREGDAGEERRRARRMRKRVRLGASKGQGAG